MPEQSWEWGSLLCGDFCDLLMLAEQLCWQVHFRAFLGLFLALYLGEEALWVNECTLQCPDSSAFALVREALCAHVPQTLLIPHLLQVNLSSVHLHSISFCFNCLLLKWDLFKAILCTWVLQWVCTVMAWCTYTAAPWCTCWINLWMEGPYACALWFPIVLYGHSSSRGGWDVLQQSYRLARAPGWSFCLCYPSSGGM